MKIWLIKLEEKLPIDENYRPSRMGMLAYFLCKRGHDVLRWSSDFQHKIGSNRFGHDKKINYSQNLTFKFLSSNITYKSPVSPLRLLNNLHIAYKFSKKAQNYQPPDLIVCSMPTTELALVSSQLGKRFNIPVIIDARDMWPDIIEGQLSGIKKVLSFPIIKMMKRNLEIACKNSTSLVGITEHFRDFLLNYADREKNENFDGVFPLSFDSSLNNLSIADKKKAQSFWKQYFPKNFNFKNKKIVYFAGSLNSTVYNALKPIVSLVKKMEKFFPNYIFVFCGKGHYEKEIQSCFINMSNMIMPGHVNSINLAYLRSISYLALQPIENRFDYTKSLSNKFFEYISSGLPIITSLRGITEFEVKKNKIGYVYKNEIGLFNVMAKLYDDNNLRNDMSKNAKKLFIDKFSYEKVYNNFAIHCENVVKNYHNLK